MPIQNFLKTEFLTNWTGSVTSNIKSWTDGCDLHS